MNNFRYACAYPNCPDQSNVWANKKGVYTHWQNKHINDVKNPVQCTVCSKKLVSSSLLKMHMQSSHHELEGKTFSCSFCGIVKASQRLLQHHEKTHQEPIGCFSCEFCDYKTYTEKSLTGHIR